MEVSLNGGQQVRGLPGRSENWTEGGVDDAQAWQLKNWTEEITGQGAGSRGSLHQDRNSSYSAAQRERFSLIS